MADVISYPPRQTTKIQSNSEVPLLQKKRKESQVLVKNIPSKFLFMITATKIMMQKAITSP